MLPTLVLAADNLDSSDCIMSTAAHASLQKHPSLAALADGLFVSLPHFVSWRRRGWKIGVVDDVSNMSSCAAPGVQLVIQHSTG